jgi:hypothetical protein
MHQLPRAEKEGKKGNKVFTHDIYVSCSRFGMDGAYLVQIGSLGSSGPQFSFLSLKNGHFGSEDLGVSFAVKEASETSTQQRGNCVIGI